MQTLSEAQGEVLAILKQYGPLPDHALVPLAQHAAPTHMSSSGIRTRRSELAALGYVEKIDYIVTTSGRLAGVWAAA